MTRTNNKTNSNFVADINLSSFLVSPERCIMQAPLTDKIMTAKGSPCIGILATMIDVACSDPALVGCRPDWTATQDLAIHTTKWLTEGPILVDAQLLRLGKKAIVTKANIYDGHGFNDLPNACDIIDNPKPNGKAPTLSAKCILTFARIPGSAASGVDNYDPTKWIGKTRLRASEKPLLGPIKNNIGMRVIDESNGIIEVACTPYIANAIGTINGGVQSVIMETAAEMLRPGLVTADIQINYLSQLKVGPTRTQAYVLRDAPDHSLISVQLTDAGANDKPLTLATVLLQK